MYFNAKFLIQCFIMELTYAYGSTSLIMNIPGLGFDALLADIQDYEICRIAEGICTV